jgi:hypothetical protein
MEKQNGVNKEKDEISKLVDLKKPFVLRDYQSYFEAKSRDLHIILTLKGWEISIISALVVFLFTQKSLNSNTISPLYLIVILFWILDSRTLVDIDMRHKDALEKEKNYKKKTLTPFNKI